MIKSEVRCGPSTDIKTPTETCKRINFYKKETVFMIISQSRINNSKKGSVSLMDILANVNN